MPSEKFIQQHIEAAIMEYVTGRSDDTTPTLRFSVPPEDEPEQMHAVRTPENSLLLELPFAQEIDAKLMAYTTGKSDQTSRATHFLVPEEPEEEVHDNSLLLDLPFSGEVDGEIMKLLFGQYDETTRMTSSLVSRVKKHKKRIKQNAPFLKLPFPLLDMIYDYVFEDNQYEIKWGEKKKSLTHWRYKVDKRTLNPDVAWANLDPDTELWKATFDAPDVDEWTIRRRHLLYLPRRLAIYKKMSIDYVPSPAAMLSVCRDAHWDAATSFYKRQSFSFSSMHLLHHFFSHLTTPARNNIRCLFVKHEFYGTPRYPKLRLYRDLHNRFWSDQLKRISLNIKKLKELHVYLKVVDREVGFMATSAWAKPLHVLQEANLDKFILELDFPACAMHSVNCKTTVTNFGLQDLADAVRKVVLGKKYANRDYLSRMPPRKAVAVPPGPRWEAVGMARLP